MLIYYKEKDQQPPVQTPIEDFEEEVVLQSPPSVQKKQFTDNDVSWLFKLTQLTIKWWTNYNYSIDTRVHFISCG